MKRRPEHLRSVPATPPPGPMVFAVIPQAVAWWLLQKVGSEAMSSEVKWRQARGQHQLAAHFNLALDQLKTAAAAEVARRDARRAR